MGKNRRSTTAKERMLKKIRHALLQKKENPYPQFEDTSLFEDLSHALSITFAEQLTRVNGHFIYCEDEFQLIENLLLLAEKRKFSKIYAWEKSIQEFLQHYEFPFFATDRDFEQAQVGITACEALIARSGSILVSSGTEAGRRLSSTPPIHIVFARKSQLVPDLKDGLALVRTRYGANSPPSMISIITGQNISHSDAQNPKESYVFFLDA